MNILKLGGYILLLGITATFSSCSTAKINEDTEQLIGELSTGGRLLIRKNADNTWGIFIQDAGLSSLLQRKPVQLELYRNSTDITKIAGGYESITRRKNGFTGSTVIRTKDVSFNVVDYWTIGGKILQLSRKVKVDGGTQAGFLSAINFTGDTSMKREDVKYFAPGMIYGNSGYITDVAIGGSKAGLKTWIREDRLPAPLFGIFYNDGTSVTILNPQPKGNTIKEDSHDQKIKTLIDPRFQFGAIGAEQDKGKIRIGYVWPGTEGETTYRGRTYPGGQVHKWRRRYHPVKDNFIQEYNVVFRFDKHEEFIDYYPSVWRWAWQVLKPKVNFQNIELVRRSLVDMLSERVETINGVTGIPNFIIADANDERRMLRRTVMGFTGKTLESANFLLQDADRNPGSEADKHRRLGLEIIQSFLKLNLSPPEGEGFNLDTGEPMLAIPRHKQVYLRSFGDGLKALLKAAKREKAEGRKHQNWVAWARSFADWLLPQQTVAGGFPRAWEPVTGKVRENSLQSAYTVIPFLILLSELTCDPSYEDAAIRAGEFCWKNGHSKGIFVGGTIDNPDVTDKEAGTLSLEAYLALYELTNEQKWLHRAKVAANFAETWIYIWNVPMPDDESNAVLPWKKGIPTTGLQLISTGHSLVDAYMAFDVDEYVKLSLLVNDPHYLEVAKILLHNTKGMLALPGRTYDLVGPGWQQEHWSLAPGRGYGIHRGWLPWVTTSHLNGIFGLEAFDKELFNQLAKEVDNYK